MKKLTVLEQYEIACGRLAEEFVGTYYDWDSTDWYFIGDETGGVLAVNDQFWDMTVIAQAMRLKPTEEQLFDFYEQWTDFNDKQPRMNLPTYLKFHDSIST